MKTLDEFLERLDSALEGADGCRDAVSRTSELLKIFTMKERQLPARLTRIDKGGYARHLVYYGRCGCCVVAMVWGPGQGTPVHDHCGTWCVEGCVQGKLEITNYELLEEMSDGRVRFDRKESMHVSPGAVGCLIPPYEHHTIRNPHSRKAITLHVYGKELDVCTRFVEEGEPGVYRVEKSPLGYCSVPAELSVAGQSIQG